MSETTVAEPPVESSPLLRRSSDFRPPVSTPRTPWHTPPVAPRNGFSFMQVAVLIGIAVFVNGLFLLFITRTPASAPAVSAPAVAPAPVAPHPVIAKTPLVKPAVVRPTASVPATITHAAKRQPAATAKRVVATAPLALAAPVIDTVEYDGPIVHMSWKSLGKGLTYKVYAMPNVMQPSFEFRYNKYGPSLDWFLDENKAWRYVAITVVRNGKESPLSNVIDTTPSIPKPEY